jgi:hypothetical protein
VQDVRSFLMESAQALGLMAGFVALGVLAALGQAESLGSGREGYLPASMADPEPKQPAELWLVDGFNVLHVGMLGGQERERWWAAERRAELLAAAGRFDAAAAQTEVWVVFDGPRPAPSDAACPVQVAFAPSADDWMLARIKEAERPVVVVTADRRLAARARHRGARVATPRAFLARC